ITLPRRFLFASSRAKTHGSVSSIYLLLRLISCQSDDKALENCIFSIASSTFVIVSSDNASSDSSPVVSACLYAGMAPAKYLSIIAPSDSRDYQDHSPNRSSFVRQILPV